MTCHNTNAQLVEALKRQLHDRQLSDEDRVDRVFQLFMQESTAENDGLLDAVVHDNRVSSFESVLHSIISSSIVRRH